MSRIQGVRRRRRGRPSGKGASGVIIGGSRLRSAGSWAVWHGAGGASSAKPRVHDAAAARVDGTGAAVATEEGLRAPMRLRQASGTAVFEIFAAASFVSVWYWVLHVVVWTLACYRTLGVPHDMLLRARRLPEIAGRVDLLAGLAAARIGGIHDRLGVPLAAGAGFLLAAVFGAGVPQRGRGGAGGLPADAAVRGDLLFQAQAGARGAAARHRRAGAGAGAGPAAAGAPVRRHRRDARPPRRWRWRCIRSGCRRFDAVRAGPTVRGSGASPSASPQPACVERAAA